MRWIQRRIGLVEKAVGKLPLGKLSMLLLGDGVVDAEVVGSSRGGNDNVHSRGQAVSLVFVPITQILT